MRTHCRPLILTPWERRALQLLADGHTTADMAASLDVSAPECETLLAALFAVMGAATQAEAIADADRRGLLMPAAMKSGSAVEAAVQSQPASFAIRIASNRFRARSLPMAFDR